MTLDLSEVTETLIKLVHHGWKTAPIWAELGGNPTFTPHFVGLAPDAVRERSGPHLSMYLYHIESDNALQSLTWRPDLLVAPGEPVRYQPLPLDLFYLLFAYSDTETAWTQEQEAMSVALRIFHANPIIRSAAAAPVPWEVTLTMEHRSYDELSRLWQATTTPLRMSVVYRVAVVLVDPDPFPREDLIKKTTAFSLSADPVPALDTSEGTSGYPVLFGTFRLGSYLGPDGEPVPFELSNLALVPGQTAWLLGSGLGTPGVSDSIYLLPAGGTTETEVTTWANLAESSSAKFVLTLPAAVGTPAAESPAPGVYQLRAGSGPLGAPGSTRSGSISVSVAAYVDPAPGPVLSGAAPFTVTGAGFIPGATEVLIGTSPLTETSGTPASGEVNVASGTQFAFAPPPGPAGTVVPVRVRVNGIESDPALWVTL
jgi:Pvc16 N-terminal domain